MATSSEPKLWNRDFVLLFASSLLLWISFYFLIPTLPSYIEDHLHGTPTQIGLVSSMLTVGAVVARPLAGYALDRWGRRGIQLALLALFSVAAFSYHLATSLWILTAIRLLHGLPFGGATTALGTVASDVVPAARRGEGLGYFGLSNNLAMAIGPAVALSLFPPGQYSMLFTSGGLVALGALLLGSIVRYPTIRDPGAKFSLTSLLERRVGWISLGTLLLYASYGGVVTFITLYAAEQGIARAGWFFSFYALGLVLSRPVSGRVFDRQGPRWPIAAGLTLMILAYSTLGLWRAEPGYLLAAVLLGLGSGATGPTVFAMAVNVVPPDRRGAANATVGTAIDVGIGGGSTVLGAVAQGVGSYASMFLVASASLLLPVLVFALKVLPSYALACERASSE